MPITILSPHSGRPVRVRDQDIGRALRDEAGRVFYIVAGAEGGGHYASMTRQGSEKDEERYRQLEQQGPAPVEDLAPAAPQVHDATGKTRRNPVGWVLVTFILLAAAGAALIYVMRPDLVPWLDKPVGTPGQTEPPAEPDPVSPGTLGQMDGVDGPGMAHGAATPPVAALQLGLEAESESGHDTAATPATTDEQVATGADDLEPVAEPGWRPAGDGRPAVAGAVPDDPLAGFRVTGSGLRYRVTEQGAGSPARAGWYVSVRYSAYRLDGAVLIDDARHHFVMARGQAIRAMEEGLAGVRAGGQRRLFVPQGHSTTGHLPGLEALPKDAFLLDVQLLDVQPGVTVVTETPGEGASAGPGDVVVLSYEARVQGRADPFDSSESRGGPLRVLLGGGDVIPGLETGLAGIRFGETRVITIPPYLGYGARGVAGGLIPPDAVLTYRVAALSVRPGGTLGTVAE